MFLCVCGDKQQLIWLPSPTQRCSRVSSVQWHLHDSQRSAHYTFAYSGIHIHSHTQTHFLSFHYLLCSTHNNTTQANHRACIAWGNKLELKLKYFFQVTFFYPLNSPCEEKKKTLRLASHQTLLVSTCRKPLCTPQFCFAENGVCYFSWCSNGFWDFEL